MSEQPEWHVGQRVVVTGAHLDGLSKVKAINKRWVTVDGSGSRFRSADGEEIVSRGAWSEYRRIRPATDEDMARITARERRRSMILRIQRDVRWDMIPDDRLEAIIALLDEAKAP